MMSKVSRPSIFEDFGDFIDCHLRKFLVREAHRYHQYTFRLVRSIKYGLKLCQALKIDILR